MISESTPIQFSDPLPAAVDVVVVGAGIIGTATAFFLAKQGKRVLLAEKGRVAGEQSSRNWGWVRQQGRDPAELPIMMESNHIWRGLAESTGERALTFTQSGCLYLARTEADMQRYEAFRDLAKANGLDSQVLDKSEVHSRTAVEGPWCGGLATPSDGRAEPFVAVPALARAAQSLGVCVIENCAIRTLDVSNNQVVGVVTESGAVKTDAVVIAGGAWSSLFLSNAGISLPQLNVRSTVARTKPDPGIAKTIPNISAPGFAIRQREDGGYTVTTGDLIEHYVGPPSFRHLTKFLPLLKTSVRDVRLRFRTPRAYPGAWRIQRNWQAEDESPFERTRVLNPKPSDLVLNRLKTRIPEYTPWLGEFEFEQCWAGMIDVTPDAVPYICKVPSTDGLFIGTGMSGHGFGIGPAVGRILSDLVLGNDLGHNLDRFRFNRFSDGSPVVPGPY